MDRPRASNFSTILMEQICRMRLSWRGGLRMRRPWGWLVGSFTLAGVIALSLIVSQSAWAAPFVAGDVFAGVGGSSAPIGTVHEFHPDGTLYQTLTNGFSTLEG